MFYEKQKFEELRTRNRVGHRQKNSRFDRHGERLVSSAVAAAKNHFAVYDRTENKNVSQVFSGLFLTTKNRRKSAVMLAADIGMSLRTLMRCKQKTLEVFACIYEMYLCQNLSLFP